MTYKKVSAREGERICRKLGLAYGMDGRTYYAVDADETRVYDFSTKKERDAFVERHNRKGGNS